MRVIEREMTARPGQARIGGAQPVLVAATLAAGFLWLYARPLASLVADWAGSAEYSHGLIVAPAALLLAWHRRRALMAEPARPAWSGILVVAVGLLLYLAGALGAERFLLRTSVIVVLAGGVLFACGPRHLRHLAAPLLLLALAIPLPAVVLTQMTMPLQLLASRIGAALLDAGGAVVLREGNLLVLPHVTLEVADACSGLRSLVSLVALAALYAAVRRFRPAVAAATVASAVPCALAMNGVRLAATAVLAGVLGTRATTGILHETAGTLTFAAAVTMVVFIGAGLARATRRTRARSTECSAHSSNA